MTLEEKRAKAKEYMRKWRKANRERHNRLARESHGRNKHKHVQRNRDYHLKTKYGITQQDYDAMLLQQDGKCRICGTQKPSLGGQRKYFHVDHDHKTGRVRSLLCVKCNTAYGWFELHREAIVNYDVDKELT